MRFDEIDGLDASDGWVSPQEIIHFDRINGDQKLWRSAYRAKEAAMSAYRGEGATSEERHISFAIRYRLLEMGLGVPFLDSMWEAIGKIADAKIRIEVMREVFEFLKAMEPVAFWNLDEWRGREISAGAVDGRAFLQGIRYFSEATARAREDRSEAFRRFLIEERFFMFFDDLDLISKVLTKDIDEQAEKGMNETERRDNLYRWLSNADDMKSYDRLFHGARLALAERKQNSAGDDFWQKSDEAAQRKIADSFSGSMRELGIVPKEAERLGDRFGNISKNIDRMSEPHLRRGLELIVGAWRAAGIAEADAARLLDSLLFLVPRPASRDCLLVEGCEETGDVTSIIEASVHSLSESIVLVRDWYGVEEKSIWKTVAGLLGEQKMWNLAVDFPVLIRAAHRWNWTLAELKTFCDEMRANGIDIGEVSRLIENSKRDLVAMSKRRPAADFARWIAYLQRKFHFVHFGRLSLDVLDAVDRPRRPHRPLAVIDMASFDWNGSLYRFYKFIGQFVNVGYDIDLREVSGKDEICEHIARAGAGKKVDVWVIAGHADNDHIRLGAGNASKKSVLSKSDDEMEKKIRPFLAQDAAVIIEGCGVAHDPDDSLAESTSFYLGGIDVWANPLVGNISVMTFGDDWRVKGANYTNCLNCVFKVGATRSKRNAYKK